jgi:hypothetical protein
MTHRMSVNQKVQIGKETTPGTTVACNKLVEAFEWSIGPKVDVKTFRATGRRHVAVAEENAQWSEGKISGEPDYNALIYPLAMCFGAVTPTLQGVSTTAYDYIWTPALTGATSVQTFTLQHGDAVEAEQYGYLMASGFNYKFARRETSCGADLFAQSASTGASITSSPTAVALRPIVGKHVNLYVDSASGSIGGTQLNNVLEVGYSCSGNYGQFWPLSRSNSSFASHLDMAPKHEVTLVLEADTTAVAYMTQLAAGTKLYMRVDAQGATIDTAIKEKFRHDMCLLLTDVTPAGDKDGVYAWEYKFEIAEDTAWNSGQAHQITVTNLLTGL